MEKASYQAETTLAFIEVLTSTETVFTSFSQRWSTSTEADQRKEVIDDLVDSLGVEAKRKKMKRVHDLATFIIDRCGSNMCHSDPANERWFRHGKVLDDRINDIVG